MRLKNLLCLTALSLGATGLLAAADSPKLDGTWTVQGGGAENDTATTWVFQDDGESMKVTRLKGTETLSDFKCNTLGKDCDFKEAGKKAKVSMWFNGPKLVQLETKGNDVIKRRFAVSDQGDTMDMELIPISPAGKTEVLHFKRVQTAAKNQ